jgi:hypothetical protein
MQRQFIIELTGTTPEPPSSRPLPFALRMSRLRPRPLPPQPTPPSHTQLLHRRSHRLRLLRLLVFLLRSLRSQLLWLRWQQWLQMVPRLSIWLGPGLLSRSEDKDFVIALRLEEYYLLFCGISFRLRDLVLGRCGPCKAASGSQWPKSSFSVLRSNRYWTFACVLKWILTIGFDSGPALATKLNHTHGRANFKAPAL